MKRFCIINIIMLVFTLTVTGQNTYRPGLYFREDWKETPPENPLNQNHVNNPELTVKFYGPSKDSLRKSHHEKPSDDPYYVWSGLCSQNWMLSLKHNTYNVDLTGFAKIKIRSKQSGLRELRITLKLTDGSWLVSDKSVGSSKDWLITEFNLQDIQWHNLDAINIVETGVSINTDLSNIEEIGITDLMPGIGRSKASSRLDWMEVYGKPVQR